MCFATIGLAAFPVVQCDGIGVFVWNEVHSASEKSMPVWILEQVLGAATLSSASMNSCVIITGDHSVSVAIPLVFVHVILHGYTRAFLCFGASRPTGAWLLA